MPFGATDAATILQQQGPMALALIAVILLLFLVSGAFIKFALDTQKHISTETVPLVVHQRVLDLLAQRGGYR